MFLYKKKKDARIRNPKYFGVHRCAGPCKLRGGWSCELRNENIKTAD